MNRSSLRGFSALTFALAWASATPCRAADEAAERFDRALKLVNTGDLTGGLVEFERAYQLTKSPVLLYNMGLVDAALGRSAEAVRTLTEATTHPDALSPANLAKATQVLEEQRQHIGSVTLSVNVTEGAVEVDNVEVARLPLSGPLTVGRGVHVIGVVATGYAPARREVLVSGGASQPLHLDLARIDGVLAHVTVKSRVPAAEVLVDGARVGETPLDASITVTPGEHRVTVRRAGYTEQTRAIALQDGARGEVTLDLAIDRSSLVHEGGWLEVSASEPQTILTVDSEEIGLVRGPFQLIAGAHRIHLESGGFLPAERDVVIPLGRTLSVPVVFEPAPETRSRYVASAESRRTWSWVTLATGVAIAGGGVALALVESGQLSSARANLDAVNADWVRGSARICDHSQALSDMQLADCATRLDDATTRVDHASTLRTVGWVGAGVGGAVAITGAVLLVTAPNPHRYDEKPPGPVADGWSFLPMVGPSGMSVTLARAF